VKSIGKSFGMKIVWYAALLAQAARVQAADEENEKCLGCPANKYYRGSL